MYTPTEAEIAQHYKAMGDSVELINEIVSGEVLFDRPVKERKATAKRNVDHLEIMLAKDFWTTQDMTAVNAAIAAGKAYDPST
jgi:DNA-directed RNA polymerase sigma subunit (sigma70/sigma32)